MFKESTVVKGVKESNAGNVKKEPTKCVNDVKGSTCVQGGKIPKRINCCEWCRRIKFSEC